MNLCHKSRRRLSVFTRAWNPKHGSSLVIYNETCNRKANTFSPCGQRHMATPPVLTDCLIRTSQEQKRMSQLCGGESLEKYFSVPLITWGSSVPSMFGLHICVRVAAFSPLDVSKMHLLPILRGPIRMRKAQLLPKERQARHSRRRRMQCSEFSR